MYVSFVLCFFLLQVVKDALIPALVGHATSSATDVLEFIANSCGLVSYRYNVHMGIFLECLQLHCILIQATRQGPLTPDTFYTPGIHRITRQLVSVSVIILLYDCNWTVVL